MPRYFLDFFAITPMSISDRIKQQEKEISAYKFVLSRTDTSSTEISIFDVLGEIGGIKLHKGLGVQILINSSNIDTAIIEGKRYAENILNFLAYSCQATTTSLDLVKAYDASQSSDNRDYRQIYRLNGPSDVRPVTEELFSKILDANKNNTDSRIARSLSLLRKGLSDDHVLDQFTAFWIALDVLDDLLKAKLPPLSSKEQGKKGLRRLFVRKMAFREVEIDELTNLRDKLFHGLAPLSDEFVQELQNCLPIVLKGLNTAIGLTLGLEEAIIQRIAETEPLKVIPLILQIDAQVKIAAIPGLLDIGLQPNIAIDAKLDGVRIGDHGKLAISLTMNFQTQNADFADINQSVFLPEHWELEIMQTKAQ